MKLYEIAEDMQGLQDLVNSGDLTQTDIEDTLDGLTGMFDDKARASLMARQNMLSDIAGIDAEIERLQKLRRAPANAVEWLEDYIKTNMLALNKDKMDLGIFKLSIRKAAKKLGELDESKIPDVYWIEVPASTKVDKKALLAAAKIEELDYAPLVDSKRSLTIK